MSSRAPIDPSALARAHGLELDPERAARLAPILVSLFERLARLSAALPEDAVPAPSAPPAPPASE